MKHAVSIGIPSIAGVAVVVLAVWGAMSSFSVETFAQAQTPLVSGWAWSYMPDQSDENIGCTDNDCGQGMGWISLNNPGYGGAVTVDQNGNFSGHAWSEYAGWIDFSPSGPYPTGPNTMSGPGRIDPISGEWSGWIRAIAPSTSAQANGWDGWISLRGSGYGIVSDLSNTSGINTSGWAWGDKVVGWIKFDWTQVVLKECLDGNQDGFDDVTGLLCNDITTAVQVSSTACVDGSVTLSWVTVGDIDSCTLHAVGFQLPSSENVSPDGGSIDVSGLGVNGSYRFILQCQNDAQRFEDSVDVLCSPLPDVLYDCGPNNKPNGINEDGDAAFDEDCPRLVPIYIHR